MLATIVQPTAGRVVRSDWGFNVVVGNVGFAPDFIEESLVTAKYYWEDLYAGKVIELGPRQVTRDEIIEFARRYDPQPFHTDEAAAKHSIYGGLIASGWHTCAMMMRMLYDGLLVHASSLGSPGVDSVRWLKPVRPGDTLRSRMTVVEARPSRSKPDRGTIKSKWEVFNQSDELVMTMEGMGMYRRRGAADAS
jgi:acyl dehydratase